MLNYSRNIKLNEHGKSFPRLSLHYLRRYRLFKSIIIYIRVHLSTEIPRSRSKTAHRDSIGLVSILIYCPFVYSHPMLYLSHVSYIFSICNIHPHFSYLPGFSSQTRSLQRRDAKIRSYRSAYKKNEYWKTFRIFAVIYIFVFLSECDIAWYSDFIFAACKRGVKGTGALIIPRLFDYAKKFRTDSLSRAAIFGETSTRIRPKVPNYPRNTIPGKFLRRNSELGVTRFEGIAFERRRKYRFPKAVLRFSLHPHVSRAQSYPTVEMTVLLSYFE